ncbi:MAG: tetratricopeptide repeat protein [Pseudomonadota bacterium]
MTEEEIQTESNAYEFAGLTLSLATRELTRDGEVIDVQRRVFDLLAFLLEHRDRTVSKDELQDAVWPGTIVTEAALSRAVMKARRAVGDDAGDPRVIRTVHGQGYRFIASVVPLTPPAMVGGTVAVPLQDDGVETAERRADLVRGLATYGALAWLVNQAAAMVWEAFEWDKLGLRVLLGLSLAGVPLVIAYLWFFRGTAAGLKFRGELAASAPPQRGAGLAIGLLLVALALSLAWNFRPVPPEPAFTQLAVLPVDSQIGDPALEWTELGLMGLINSVLEEGGLVPVRPTDVLRILASDPSNAASATEELSAEILARLRRETGARLAVQAELARAGAAFVVKASLFDNGVARPLPGFTADSPSEAAASLAAFIVGELLPVRTLRVDDFQSDDLFVDQAFARGMHEVISGNLEDAQNLLRVAHQAEPQAFWPAYELGVIEQKLGDYPQAKQRLEALLAALPEPPPRRQVARIHNALGIIADLTGRLDDAEAHYREGLDFADAKLLPDVRAVLWINAAIAARAQGDLTRAREYLGSARSAYTDAGIEVVHGDFYVALGNIAADSGDMDEAQAQYRLGLEAARVRRTPQAEGVALSNLSFAARQLGDYDEAASYLAEAEALRERIGDRMGMLRSRNSRAALMFQVGSLATADAVASSVLEAPEAKNDGDLATTALATRGNVALARGDGDAALTFFSEALRIERTGGTRFGLLRALDGRGRALLHINRLAEAAVVLSTMREENEDAAIPRFADREALLKAGLQRARGEQDAAEATLRAALDRARSAGTMEAFALIASRLVPLLIDAGRLDEAAAVVGMAVDATDREPNVVLAQFRLAHARGQAERAASLRERLTELAGDRFALELAALGLVDRS